MKVDFYQLARPVEQVLPRIAERLTAAGERLLVVAESEALLKRLAECFWTYASESFLAHGRAGEDDAEQPILLSAVPAPGNAATNIALADGRWRDEALTFERAFHLFGEETLDVARACWKTLKDQPSVERRFWKQDGGKWMQIT